MFAEEITVGLVLREDDMARHPGRLGALAADAVDAGIDHLTVGDHVSFGGGHGADGLVQATALLASHPTVAVQTGVWVSPRRFAEAVERIGRDGLHTLQLWAGFGRSAARTRRVMEDSYGLPFERFARYTPCGGPEDVAEALLPYVEAGCRRFNFV